MRLLTKFLISILISMDKGNKSLNWFWGLYNILEKLQTANCLIEMGRGREGGHNVYRS